MPVYFVPTADRHSFPQETAAIGRKSRVKRRRVRLILLRDIWSGTAQRGVEQELERMTKTNMKKLGMMRSVPG